MLDKLYKLYQEDLEAIREDCRAEGFPDNGSNFELRVEELKKMYPELWEDE